MLSYRAMTTSLDARTALAALWRSVSQADEALSQVTLTGAEPALPSSFPVGTAAQASIAAAALAAGELWQQRTGRRQQVAVDMRAAAIECRSERYLQVAGTPMPNLWDKIAGAYRCGDRRWVRLHTNFAHHRDGVLRLLHCDHERDAVKDALQRWSAETFETAAAEAGLVVTAMRTFAEWDAHGQGAALARMPLMSIDWIGDARPRPLPAGDRPLSGARVLDLTRIIAGPVAGRTLAVHGADVLQVSAPHLPAIELLVIDNGRGKLATHVDLRDGAGRETLKRLLRDAHVFVQGYRPGGLQALGFGPEEVAKISPGIVYVSLSAYGHEGPWAARRGFDSLMQTASGFNAAEGEAAGTDKPRALPCQILDHTTGFLMAFAAMTALKRQVASGGSWHVRLSLAQTGRWLRSLGRIDGLSLSDPTRDDVRDRLEESDSGFGRLSAVRHSAEMSETPPRWARPSVPLGTHAPEWP
jgi:crotonobetainyl-CoA:carnitine CoA-transferase CaiB-like acyl-CoA transferase